MSLKKHIEQITKPTAVDQIATALTAIFFSLLLIAFLNYAVAIAPIQWGDI